jgi:hypothetical protein
MPDPAAEEDWSFDGPQEDAAEIYASITQEEFPQVEVYYQDEKGERKDPNLVVSLDQAAADLKNYHDQNSESALRAISSEFGEAIDAMRREKIGNDPKLPEHYGIEVPKTEKAAAAEGAEAHENDAFDEMPGLDEPTKALLRNPQTREALEQNEQRTAAVTEAYNAALANANSFAQASFLEGFPELAALPAEHLHAGLNQLAQTNPERFNQAMGVLNRVSQIQNAQQQVQAQTAQRAKQEFDHYATQQDASFREMVGNDRGKIQTVANEIVSYAAEMGVPKDTFINLLATQPIMRHAAFQKMMYDAAQFRMMKNAPKPTPTRAVPPVQRPGTSRPAGEVASENVQALDRALSKSGSLKDAERLLFARMKGR